MERARKWVATAVLGALLAIGISLPAGGANPRVDTLQMCVNDASLDCVESLEIQLGDGTWSSLEYVGWFPGTAYTDPVGNLVNPGFESFIFGNTVVNLDVQLDSLDHIIQKLPDGKLHTGAALRANIQVAEGNSDNFRLKVRTSWMNPQDIQLHAVDASLEDQKIPGGRLWTFTGKQQKIHGYDYLQLKQKMESHANADFEFHRISFFLHHLGKSSLSSYFDVRCGEKGYTVESHNAPGAGMPYWNEGTKSLEFNIQSAHADRDGRPVVGYFKLWMPVSYMDCMWPQNTLTNAAEIQVLVANEDGSYQVASTVVGRANGQIRVEATGFHYSSPTVILRAKPSIKSSTLSNWGSSSKVSSKQGVKIRNYVAMHSNASKFTCSGTYSTISKKAQAQARAVAACKVVQKNLPKVNTAVTTKKVTASNAGKVLITASSK